jgi:hypothetical protein
MSGVNLQSLSTRERLILLLAAVVAFVFVFTRGVPIVTRVYAERTASVESVQLDIERELRLQRSAELWSSRRAETERALANAEAGLFSGSTNAIVEASIQQILSQHAASAGIEVNSTRLAETLEQGDWTLVSQEMSFRTSDAAATVDFLSLIEQSIPRLEVTEFSLDRSRNQFSGAITVVGFARSARADRQLSARSN